jgi:hypothetical protein
MTREEAIENLIRTARGYKEAKRWASQNSAKMLDSSISSSRAAEIMSCYFDKEFEHLEAIDELDRIDGVKYTTEITQMLEEWENK